MCWLLVTADHQVNIKMFVLITSFIIDVEQAYVRPSRVWSQTLLSCLIIEYLSLLRQQLLTEHLSSSVGKGVAGLH